jgi:hypothetical protein
VNKRSKEKAESLLGILASDIRKELKWRLENLDNLPTLDDIMRTQKKRPKRIADGRDLKEKIAELFRAIEDEKRAKRVEANRHVARAIGELIRAVQAEKNPKRAAQLDKKVAELLEYEEKSKRAAASGNLKKTIAEVFRAIDELKSGGSVSQGLLDRARELAQGWYPEFGQSKNPLVVLLAGLVIAQKREIESLVKVSQLFTFTQAGQKRTSKQRHDIGRRYVPVVGKIEWEFGGVRPPHTSDMNDSARNCLKPPEPPTCLDDIFAGHPVNMRDLVQLFGRDRHLLSKIPGVTIKWRDYRTVTGIMDALLNGKRRPPKSSSRGRPKREPWLSDPPATNWRPVNYFWPIRHYCRSLRSNVRKPLRTRVLNGIQERLDGLSERMPTHIKSEFLAVIRRHLLNSAKK